LQFRGVAGGVLAMARKGAHDLGEQGLPRDESGGGPGGAVFREGADDAAFEGMLAEAVGRVAMRILTCCLMPNHFHLVLWPRRGQGRGLWDSCGGCVTHTQRWHGHDHTSGTGRL